MDALNDFNGVVIFGEMCTGKDTLGDMLMDLDKKCNKYNIGNVVRQFFPILKVNQSFKGKNRILGQRLADKLREVDPQILNDYCLSVYYEKWEKFFQWKEAPDIDFKETLMKRLSQIKLKEIPLIIGGRTYDDFNYWSGKKFLTLGITCQSDIRFDRLVKRDGIEIAKNSNFKHNTEIDVGEISKNKCEIVIDNSGDFSSLKKQAEYILELFK
ncbi:MAG TPA: hypothetical protein VIK72_09955 [Clostridiaceae bacterium]